VCSFIFIMKNSTLKRKIIYYRTLGYKPKAICKLTGVPIVTIVKLCVGVKKKQLSTADKLVTIKLDNRLQQRKSSSS